MPKKQTTQKVITPVAADNSQVRSDYDIYLLKQGNHFGLYKKLGAHLVGVPRAGYWREVLNSDSREYGVAAWVISARSNRCPQRSAAAFIPCR
jgi:1,4-alpha-glucan branching enzyme